MTRTINGRTKLGMMLVALMGLSHSHADAGGKGYRFYSFPQQGGYNTSTYHAVNDLGVVVGSADDGPVGGAAYWSNGVLTDLWEAFDEVYLFFIADVSETGAMVAPGERWWVGGHSIFLIREGELLELQVPPGCEENFQLLGVSPNGSFTVGYCLPDGGSPYTPALYWTDDGSATSLAFPPEAPADTWGYANAVNDDGIVVGGAVYPDVNCSHALFWKNGVVTEAPNPFGSCAFALNDINNRGYSVGAAWNQELAVIAVAYDVHSGVSSILGCGGAVSVNDHDQAVGWDSSGGTTYAVLYENGTSTYLNEYLPEGWFSPLAEDINNYGWIIGRAFDELDNEMPWLLVPIYSKGDFDGDEDVDLQDFGYFQRCFAAEPYIDGTLHIGCSVFDFDDDIDLDLTDYEAFQAVFTGPLSSEP